VTLHVREYGDRSAPPVVYLHGITATGAQVRRLAEERLSRFHVLAPDLRGHGRSPQEPPWNLERLVDDVLAIAPARAAWIGMSFGGRVALEVATRAPERVERLVLLEPVPHLPAHVAFDMAEHVTRARSWPTADEAIAAQLPPDEHARSELRENLVAEDGRWRWRYSPAAVAAIFGELARPAPSPPRIPTLLITGGSSFYLLDNERAALERALGDDLRSVGVDAGHGIFWEAFAAVGDAVAGFLEDPRAER
jgi:lipase